MAKESQFTKNFASDTEIAGRFLEYVKPILHRTRRNRRTLEAQWVDDTRLWSCILDDAGYSGFSNVFVPELHNQIENTTEKMVAAAFANPELIYAIAMKDSDKGRAEKIRNAVTYELQAKNNLLTRMDEFDRSKVLYGTSVFKGSFEKEMREIYYKDPTTKRMRRKDVPVKLGTYWEVRPMFRWYIYPEFSRLDKYEVIFEDSMMARSSLDKDKYKNLDNISYGADDLEHLWVNIELLEMVELMSCFEEKKDRALVTEVFCMFEIEKDKPVPVQAFIANNQTVIRLTRNPFWWQDHNYLSDVYTQRPNGLFYGLSLPDKLRSQQYQMNDTANHTMDSLNYALSPMAVIDPALAGDVNSMKVHPGAKWLGSPEGIQMMTFPDVSGSGLRVMQEIRSQVAQFSDSSPGLAPQLEGKARSATQASIVQSNVSTRQRVQAGREEENVLGPMCKMTYMMLQQFMDVEWMIRTQGADAGSWIVESIKPDDMVGDIDFIWKGTSYSQKSAVRSQQLLAFFNQSIQIAAMMPGEIDVAGLWKRIAREAFELSDVDEIFKSLRDKKTVSAEIENISLRNGDPVTIHNGDNDLEHIKDHDMLLDEKLDDEAKMVALNHIESHKEQYKAKQEVIQLRARLEAMKAQGMEAPNVPGVNGGPDGPPSPMEGNQSQVPVASSDVMTGARGVNPV